MYHRGLSGLAFAFLTPKSVLILASYKFPDRKTSHNNTDFGAQIPFLGIEGLFSPLSIYNCRSMDVSHDHTDFGAQIPFLGFQGLLLLF
jgi:hypothetical protein